MFSFSETVCTVYFMRLVIPLIPSILASSSSDLPVVVGEEVQSPVVVAVSVSDDTLPVLAARAYAVTDEYALRELKKITDIMERKC